MGGPTRLCWYETTTLGVAWCLNASKLEELSLYDNDLAGTEAAQTLGHIVEHSLPNPRFLNVRGNMMYQLEYMALKNILGKICYE